VTTTTGTGRALAENLGLTIVGTEGHDLKTACPFCTSTDAGRIHQDTGAYWCFSCHKGLSGYDLAKMLLNDQAAAVAIMREVGLFDASYMGPGHNGNGHVPAAPPSSNGHAAAGSEQPTDATIETMARLKNVSADAFRAYGARARWRRDRGHYVSFPVFDSDGHPHFWWWMSEATPKGEFEPNSHHGLFLPFRLPQPSEQWIVVEGVKDAAALWMLGFNAAGLPTNCMAPHFSRLFADVDVVLFLDCDVPSLKGATKTTNALRALKLRSSW
jgi:hypothetical protein